MLHNCSDEISGSFQNEQVSTKWDAVPKVSFGNATAVCAALRRDKPDPEAVTPRRDLLDAKSIGLAPSCREFFMKLIDFLISKTWTKNRCSSLFVPVLSGAPTITELQKGQINYLPCLCVRRICLLLCIDYWIWRIFQYFSSVSFFFLAGAPIGAHLHSCLARAPTAQLMLWTCSQMCLFQRSGSFEKLG